MSDRFGLTPAERDTRLPSGVQTVIHNRVGWAKWHLEKLGYVATVRRGIYRITDAGKQRGAVGQTEFSIAEARAFLAAGEPQNSAVTGSDLGAP